MKKSSVVLAMALLAASAARAENGFYVLGAAGVSRVDDFVSRGDLEDFAGAPFTSYSEEDIDAAFKLQFGYQFNDYFALEGGYVDLGKATATGKINETVANVPLAYKTKVDWKAKGVNVAALLTLPVNAGWSLFFKVGAVDAKVDAKVSESIHFGALNDGYSDSYDDTSIKANFGFGVKWAFVEHFGLRAELERFNKLGDSDKTGESSVDFLSIGAYYQF